MSFQFFDRNGEPLGVFNFNEPTWGREVGFLSTSPNIAGFSFHNEDSGGTALEAIYFGTLPPSINVPVDIRPGSCPNPLNCISKGVLPVAILGTADFDVMDIDPATVRLAGVAPLRWDYEDVATPYEPFTGKQDCDLDCNEMGPDGYMDATLKFDTQEVVAALGEEVQGGACIVAQLTGYLRESKGGTEIVGEDVIRIRCTGN